MSSADASLIAVTLVGALRARGGRPAGLGPNAPSWGTVADRSRLLALGLEAVGIGAGCRVRVDPDGLDPHEVVERELAVLATGGVLLTSDNGGDDGGQVDATIGARSVTGESHLELDEVRERGRAIDADAPDRFETRLRTLEPDAPALDMSGTIVSSSGVCWALRCVDRWLSGIPAHRGPALGLQAAGRVDSHSRALLERWWPASIGAPLASAVGALDAVSLTRASAPALIVADAERWNELVGVVRSAAARSRHGRALLRRGRLVEAGESDRIVDRLGVVRGRRRHGSRLRSAAGLDRLVLGVSLGALDPVTGRDLAAAGVPVTATWLEPGVLAPLAAGSVARPRPSSPWGRLLPGRTIEVDGDRTVVFGGDLTGSTTVPRRMRIDDRSRVLVPHAVSTIRSEHAGDAR